MSRVSVGFQIRRNPSSPSLPPLHDQTPPLRPFLRRVKLVKDTRSGTQSSRLRRVTGKVSTVLSIQRSPSGRLGPREQTDRREGAGSERRRVSSTRWTPFTGGGGPGTRDVGRHPCPEESQPRVPLLERRSFGKRLLFRGTLSSPPKDKNNKTTTLRSSRDPKNTLT